MERKYLLVHIADLIETFVLILCSKFSIININNIDINFKTKRNDEVITDERVIVLRHD